MQRNNKNRRKNRWIILVGAGIIVASVKTVSSTFKRKESNDFRKDEKENAQRIQTFYEKNI